MQYISSLFSNPHLYDECVDLLHNEFIKDYDFDRIFADSIKSSDMLPQAYILIEDNKVIGFCGLIESEVIQRNDLKPFISPLLVAAKKRGNKYGALLLEYARRDANRLGYQNVYLTTNHIGYYEKYDFKEIGLTLFNWGQPTKLYEATTIFSDQKGDFLLTYKDIIKKWDESKYIINITSIENLIHTGISLGLNEKSKVLDLCCGYGTMLKIWSEAFGINGVGVDRCDDFINKGISRLAQAGINRINLIKNDVLIYEDEQKYDVVSCTETIESINATLELMEKFIKPGGNLVYCHVYSKIPSPPQELIDFEGEMPTLDELYKIFREKGYYIVGMISDTVADWDRYITSDSKQSLIDLRSNPNNIKLSEWIDKWYHMYFNFRRPYEGQAMFVLEKL